MPKRTEKAEKLVEVEFIDDYGVPQKKQVPASKVEAFKEKCEARDAERKANLPIGK